MQINKIISVTIAVLLSLSLWANTGARLQLSLITEGGNPQTVKVVATVINGNFEASDGTDDWSTGKITLRIKYTGENSVPMVASAPAVDPNITGETNNGYFGAGINGFKNNFSSSLDLMSYRLDSPGVGGVDDGYVYLNMNDGVSTPNMPLLLGAQIVLFEFQLPGAWSCNECVEFVTTDRPGGITEGTYYLNSGIGGSTNVFVVGDNSTALPVELTSWKVNVFNDCDVELHWSAEMENDLEYYEIEASTDGVSFVTVQRLFAMNNDVTQEYSFSVSPEYQDMIFRLKIVDNDGVVKLSPILHAPIPCSKNYGLKVFPNPDYYGQVVVEVLGNGENGLLEITDYLGRVLQQTAVTLAENRTQIVVNTRELPTGFYQLRIIGVKQLEQLVKLIRIQM